MLVYNPAVNVFGLFIISSNTDHAVSVLSHCGIVLEIRRTLSNHFLFKPLSFSLEQILPALCVLIYHTDINVSTKGLSIKLEFKYHLKSCTG